MSEGTYRGWKTWRGPDHPPTGQFRGEKYGVDVSAGSEEALHRIIDQRIKEYPEEGRDDPGRLDWLKNLDEETREKVYVVMRQMEERKDDLYRQAIRKRPAHGTVAVGGVGGPSFDLELQAQSLEELLRYLGRGATPDAARTAAHTLRREMVTKWNERVEWQAARDVECAGNGIVDFWWRQILAVVPRKEEPEFLIHDEIHTEVETDPLERLVDKPGKKKP